MALDPYAVAGLVLTSILTLCVVIMFTMRDREWAPPRPVTRTLWCEERRRTAVVDFIERTDTGIVIRTVQHCSLRGADGRCDETCRDLPSGEMRPLDGLARPDWQPA